MRLAPVFVAKRARLDFETLRYLRGRGGYSMREGALTREGRLVGMLSVGSCRTTRRPHELLLAR
jgi:hypothetical protein